VKVVSFRLAVVFSLLLRVYEDGSGIEFGRSRTGEGSSGGGKKGVVSGVGQERLGPSYFFKSLVLGPLNSLLWYVPSSRYTWSSAPILFLQEPIKVIIIISYH
jgi:hypothetical protein